MFVVSTRNVITNKGRRTGYRELAKKGSRVHAVRACWPTGLLAGLLAGLMARLLAGLFACLLAALAGLLDVVLASELQWFARGAHNLFMLFLLVTHPRATRGRDPAQ